MFIPTLQMKKLRIGKVTFLTQNPTASKSKMLDQTGLTLKLSTVTSPGSSKLAHSLDKFQQRPWSLKAIPRLPILNPCLSWALGTGSINPFKLNELRRLLHQSPKERSLRVYS